MACILVTGAAGFIGSHVTDALLARGDKVVGVDIFNTFYDPTIKRRNILQALQNSDFQLIEGDLGNAQVRKRCLNKTIDGVIHLAASAGVRPSLEAPAYYFENNVANTASLLEDITRTYAHIPLVLASSSSVYGTNTKVPFAEDDRIENEVSPYASSKHAMEIAARGFHLATGFPITCLRFFTVYGPRQRPEMAIHKFMQLMMDGEKIPMFGDGSSGRDYTYVDDIVRGVLASLDRADAFHIYNLGNSSPMLLKDLIQEIGVICGATPEVEQLPDQKGDVPLTFADIARASSELDYNPKTPIQDGLRIFHTWLKKIQ